MWIFEEVMALGLAFLFHEIAALKAFCKAVRNQPLPMVFAVECPVGRIDARERSDGFPPKGTWSATERRLGWMKPHARVPPAATCQNLCAEVLAGAYLEFTESPPTGRRRARVDWRGTMRGLPARKNPHKCRKENSFSLGAVFGDAPWAAGEMAVVSSGVRAAVATVRTGHG
jgi:hypothetical protein